GRRIVDQAQLRDGVGVDGRTCRAALVATGAHKRRQNVAAAVTHGRGASRSAAAKGDTVAEGDVAGGERGQLNDDDRESKDLLALIPVKEKGGEAEWGRRFRQSPPACATALPYAPPSSSYICLLSDLRQTHRQRHCTACCVSVRDPRKPHLCSLLAPHAPWPSLLTATPASRVPPLLPGAHEQEDRSGVVACAHGSSEMAAGDPEDGGEGALPAEI
ncbi:hypothetical protein Taro_017694, partial [Colocasia esculenta]|nr:hypothetical protein [Colocasia esculenta]